MIAQYLPDGPYRFSMAFGRGNFADFYGASADDGKILLERKRWLGTDPQRYLAILPESAELLHETVRLAQEHGTLTEAPPSGSSPAQLALFLGERWEPDFLLLKPEGAALRLVCGCVCFPSSWALEEKIGHPIERIHHVVPNLNPTIGRQIQTFLEKLKPGVSWTRSNWGLSRSPELNQHPSRKIPRLDNTISLDEVFFRVEEQSLVALPETRGILFGIRIKVFPLSGYAGTEEGSKLAHALETMPAQMAEYKGVASSRARIIALLRG
ncbi:MAG: heme-dependent oxidative N-demethylase subunit alpha family protein [Limisphaerales bacterium]